MTTFKNEPEFKPVSLNEKGFQPVRFNRPKPDDNWPYHGHPTTPHDREFGIRNPKFERHMYVRRDQIFYDIDAQLSIIAKARRSQDGTEDNTISQATNDFKPMFYRWIDTYIGKAKTIMSAFVLERFNDTAINSIKDNEEVDITLLVPQWYDDTTYQQLCDAVHSYIVNGAMREYFLISLTSKDPVTIDKNQLMLDGENEIRKLVNASKPGQIRKPLNPF